MRHSVLVQRVYAVVVMALAFTAIFTALSYAMVSRSVFSRLKAAELLPKARAFGRMVAAEQSRDPQLERIGGILGEVADDSALLSAHYVVVDAQGEPVLMSEALSQMDLEAYRPSVQKMLSGEEIALYGKWPFSRINVVCVGAPIHRGGQVTGGVLMLVPLYEAMAASGSMNSALMLSLLIILPMTLVLVYLVVSRIVLPLKQMRDVAISMAEGDYQARANDEQRGEVGQLARSLNHLSQELYKNINKLTVERNRLQQSVDGLREGFVAVDSMGRVEHYNPAVVQMFSMLPRKGNTRQLTLIPDEQVWEDFREAMRERESRIRDIPVLDRLIHATISPLIDENGASGGAVGLFTDITEQDRLERTRRDYVANVSHELRSPLTAMRALLEPLRDGMVRDEAARQRYYDILLRETLRLSRLINDLMELSRLQSGTLALDRAPLSLEEMVNDLAERYRLMAEENGKRFELRFDPAQCPAVLTNEDRTEEILVILLDNAMKYTPEGGVISLEGDWNREKVMLTVRDTGVGIDPKDLPYVFDRFYKVDKSHGSTGSGLGLSIAREVLSAMGETITVESTPGEGSAFRFTLSRAG